MVVPAAACPGVAWPSHTQILLEESALVERLWSDKSGHKPALHGSREEFRTPVGWCGGEAVLLSSLEMGEGWGAP